MKKERKKIQVKKGKIEKVLQAPGNQTYLYFPRDWSEANNLRKGDFVEVEIKEHEIIVRPARKE